MDRVTQLSVLLQDIEVLMRNIKIWDNEAPQGIYESNMPFAANVAVFPQWLQFIFIPTLRQLIDQQMQLPDQSGITEMAKFYFSQQGQSMTQLIRLLEQVDELLCCSEKE